MIFSTRHRRRSHHGLRLHAPASRRPGAFLRLAAATALGAFALLPLWFCPVHVKAMPDRSPPRAGSEQATRDDNRPLPALGVLVAQTFLRAVAEGDLRTAAPLCAQAVDFDGEMVRGADRVRARLEELKKRAGEGRPLSRVVIMRLERARQRFGPPPSRISLPRGVEIMVGFGRFARGGLIVFLAPEAERWRVVALTD